MSEKGGGFKCGRTGTRFLVPTRPKVNLRSDFSASLIHQLEYTCWYVSLYVEWNSPAPLQNKMHFVGLGPRAKSKDRPPAGYRGYTHSLAASNWQMASIFKVSGGWERRSWSCFKIGNNSSLNVAHCLRLILRTGTPQRRHALLDSWNLVIKSIHSKP